jgi:hypothetical protein
LFAQPSSDAGGNDVGNACELTQLVMLKRRMWPNTAFLFIYFLPHKKIIFLDFLSDNFTDRSYHEEVEC